MNGLSVKSDAEYPLFSQLLLAPVMYISNFDEDLLIFGITDCGETITCEAIGTGLEAYELDAAMIDISKFRKYVGIFDAKARSIICESHDIFTVEKELERILNIPLYLKERDIEASPAIYEKIQEEAGVCVYELRHDPPSVR